MDSLNSLIPVQPHFEKSSSYSSSKISARLLVKEHIPYHSNLLEDSNFRPTLFYVIILFYLLQF